MADIQERKVFDLIEMTSLEKGLTYAKWAIENKVAPKGVTDVAQYFMLLQAGNDLGMDLATIHNSLAIINGRVTMWGKEVLVRAKRAGYKISYPEKSETKVVVIIEREGEKHTETYTIEKARKAGLLTRDTWMKYPEEMLTHKAVARAIDNFCPEVLGGLSIKEDMDDTSETRRQPRKPKLEEMVTITAEEVPLADIETEKTEEITEEK